MAEMIAAGSPLILQIDIGDQDVPQPVITTKTFDIHAEVKRWREIYHYSDGSCMPGTPSFARYLHHNDLVRFLELPHILCADDPCQQHDTVRTSAVADQFQLRGWADEAE